MGMTTKTQTTATGTTITGSTTTVTTTALTLTVTATTRTTTVTAVTSCTVGSISQWAVGKQKLPEGPLGIPCWFKAYGSEKKRGWLVEDEGERANEGAGKEWPVGLPGSSPKGPWMRKGITEKECAEACNQIDDCFSFTFMPVYGNICYIKQRKIRNECYS